MPSAQQQVESVLIDMANPKEYRKDAVTGLLRELIAIYKKEFDSEWMSAFKATVSIALDCAQHHPRSSR